MTSRSKFSFHRKIWFHNCWPFFREFGEQDEGQDGQEYGYYDDATYDEVADSNAASNYQQ